MYNNDNFEKLKKRIDKYRNCYIQGPTGPKGNQGDMGPRGLPGEIGRTEHIAIDETETLETGEPAQVMDTFENWVHHLAFLIPKGEKGATGERVHKDQPDHQEQNLYLLMGLDIQCLLLHLETLH